MSFDQNFSIGFDGNVGRSWGDRLTLGGEAEYWAVMNGLLQSAAKQVFNSKDYKTGRLRVDLPGQQFEAVTGACADPEQFERDMERNERELADIGRTYGFGISTEPVPWYEDFKIEVFPDPRYEEILRRLGEDKMRPGWIIGLHMHLGNITSGEMIVLSNALRDDLPMMLALSARSQQKYGEDRGYASERFLLYCSLYPKLVTPYIRDTDHLKELARELGFADNYKDCWWLLRFNLAAGTLENRVCDMQEKPAHAAQLAALYRVRGRMALEGQLVPSLISSGDLFERLCLAAQDRSHRESYQAVVCETAEYAESVGWRMEASYIRDLMHRMGWR